MKVLVTGDRSWTDFGAIRDFLEEHGATIVVHGGASGADELAGFAATALGIECRVHEANWKEFGRKAGPIRNKDMFNEEQPDIVGAFHDVWKMAEAFEVSQRIAAYMLAIDRVSRMAKVRGVYA